MSSTTAGAERTLRYLLAGTPYLAGGIASWFIGLSTSTIAIDGTGVVEPTGGSYARIEIASGSANWTLDEINSEISNATEISFNKASSNWGIIKEIFMSLDGGTSASSIQYHQAVIPNIPVNAETQVIIPLGSLIIKRDSRSYQTE